MPFGDTAKKIQRVTTIVEESYERLNQLVGQLQDLRDRVEATSDQIESMDRELEEQRAVVEALAREQGVDVDAVVAEVRHRQGGAAERAAAASSAETATTEREDDGTGSPRNETEETDTGDEVSAGRSNDDA